MNPADIMKYGQIEVRKAMEGLPDAEWETPNVCGVWSSKDVLAHLASFECMLCDVLRTFLGGTNTPVLDQMLQLDPDEFNAVQVSQRRARPWRDVAQELEEMHSQAMALARQIPPETWRKNGMLPWYGDDYSLDDFIVYTFYGHKREHSAQINVFKDVLKTR